MTHTISRLSLFSGMLAFSIGSFFISPLPAYALQTHLGKEGIFVHQGAHLFFALSMIFFAVNICCSSLVGQKIVEILFGSSTFRVDLEFNGLQSTRNGGK